LGKKKKSVVKERLPLVMLNPLGVALYRVWISWKDFSFLSNLRILFSPFSSLEPSQKAI
jgi:hypothetical protein